MLVCLYIENIDNRTSISRATFLKGYTPFSAGRAGAGVLPDSAEEVFGKQPECRSAPDARYYQTAWPDMWTTLSAERKEACSYKACATV